MEKQENIIYKLGFLIGRVFIAYPSEIRDVLFSKKLFHRKQIK